MNLVKFALGMWLRDHYTIAAMEITSSQFSTDKELNDYLCKYFSSKMDAMHVLFAQDESFVLYRNSLTLRQALGRSIHIYDMNQETWHLIY